jgi:hypothetical protein
MRSTHLSVMGALMMLLLPSAASAQRLELTLVSRVITFTESDPDVVPVIAAAPLQVQYRIRQNTNVPWTLTVRANGDLIAGTATVDISNVSWVATPAPPFQNGTLSRTVEQTLASGDGNVNPARTGSVIFRLANSWTYSAGNYTQTVLFTLSAP